MKKFLTPIALIAILTLAGCGSTNSATTQDASAASTPSGASSATSTASASATLTAAGSATASASADASKDTEAVTTSAAPATAETSGAPANSAAPASAGDLTGEWKQINSNSEDSYQTAMIEGDVITVNWISDGGATKNVYWVGTFAPPTSADGPYTWTSERDKPATDMALMASTADTKKFTYEDGLIRYELTALGTTMTVELEKQ